MSEDTQLFWRHALTALNTARQNLQIDPSTAANRAYYAVFYAVSALFATEGKTFKRHAGVERAVHRDLVNAGRWPEELGSVYRQLHRLRGTADYDITKFVAIEEAQAAVKQAERIVEAVRASCPGLDQNGPSQDAGP